MLEVVGDQRANGATGEYVELTNLGASAVDFSGWSFDDSSRTAGSTDLSAFGSVAPGASVILTEASADDFRTAWTLAPSVQEIGGNTHNLGRSDEINLYNAIAALVDRLTYGDAVYPGTVRAQNFGNHDDQTHFRCGCGRAVLPGYLAGRLGTDLDPVAARPGHRQPRARRPGRTGPGSLGSHLRPRSRHAVLRRRRRAWAWSRSPAPARSWAAWPSTGPAPAAATTTQKASPTWAAALLTEERLQDAYRLGYTAGGSVTLAATAWASIGSTVGNLGTEGD